jgi:hypothetical protein
MGHAGNPTFTLTAAPTAGTVTIAAPSEPFDKNLADSNLYLFQAIPAQPGQQVSRRGLRFLGSILGATPVPPTVPAVLDTLYTLNEGQTVTVQAIYQDPDFRTGNRTEQTCLAEDP